MFEKEEHRGREDASKRSKLNVLCVGIRHGQQALKALFLGICRRCSAGSLETDSPGCWGRPHMRSAEHPKKSWT